MLNRKTNFLLKLPCSAYQALNLVSCSLLNLPSLIRTSISLLIHEADPQSVHPLPLFKYSKTKQSSSKNYSDRYTGVNVRLAEWIIDGLHVLCILVLVCQVPYGTELNCN